MKRTIVLGGPGTGKTSRLMEIVAAALDRGVPPSKIALVAFTNSAADVAVERACKRFGLSPKELPYFRTIHSFAYRQLGLRGGDVLGNEHLAKISELTGELLRAGSSADEGPALGMNADPLLTLEQYARTSRKTLRRAWEDHGGDLDWFRLKRFVDAYRLYKEDLGLLDFTDLLEKYLEGEPAPVDVEIAIVDEAQDLTLLQWEVIERAFAGAREMYVAGDDLQCQPGAVRVLTSKNIYKAIADLDPKKDRLVAYARGEALQGFRTGGYSFKKSSQLYSGELFSVTAGGNTTECTHNHKWYARWDNATRSKGLCVVYIMRKRNKCRVGWCQMFGNKGAFGLNGRANIEGAEHVWALKVFGSRRKAYAYEQIINARYGIPMAPFKTHSGDLVRQDVIDEIYRTVSGLEGAKRALIDHGMSIDYPLLNRRKVNYSRYNNVIMTVEACNLIPGLMKIPVRDGKTNVKWHPLTVERRSVKNLRVYGLDVEKHHTYIVDEIITHNSVHRWAGAAEDRFLALDYERDVIPLSRRIPRAIHAVAQGVADRVVRKHARAWEPADRDGEVTWFGSPDEVDLTSGSWLLMARTRAQLSDLAAAARERGVVYRVKGKSSVDPAHVRAIQAHEALRAGKRVGGEDVKLALKAARVRRQSVSDGSSYTALELKYDASPIWHDALIGIPLDTREYYLSCVRRGEKLTAEPRVVVETIHGAKGAEAENALLVTDLTYRTQRGYEIDPDAELRVFFVGLTRASQTLNLLAPQTAYGFPL